MTDADPRFGTLRAENLKLRGCLFDPTTLLPSLPAVIDDIRRRIEAGERVALIYLDLSAEEVLEEVYGWETFDRVLAQVAALLIAFRDKHLTQADSLSLLSVRGDEFVLCVGCRGKRGEELAELNQLRNSLVSMLASQLRIQVGNETARTLQLLHSGTVVRYAPTLRIERSIYRTIDQLRAICRREKDLKHALRLNELRRIVADEDIRVRYQPIVNLADGRIHGFEALSAGPDGDIFENTEMLFTFAEATDQIIDLERICRRGAVRGATSLPAGRRLFINCSAHGFTDPELATTAHVASLADAAVRASDLEPSDIVFEVTERVALSTSKQFQRVLGQLRESGYRIAVDDMGAGYSSLQSVADIQPDYLKFDISLVRDLHRSPIKRNLLDTLVSFADKLGAQVIAEGVEKDQEFHTLRGMGVPYAQGYFFAPPEPAPGRSLVYFPPDVAGEG
jgi:EAL domain-containing protein (putative c-di-GMP-specific phosphodiesterase class I)